jgi:hypothetical protein
MQRATLEDRNVRKAIYTGAESYKHAVDKPFRSTTLKSNSTGVPVLTKLRATRAS